MTDHLRFAEKPALDQRLALEQLVRANGKLMDVLAALHRADLPDALVGGGAVYQSVWNMLTGRDAWHGIKDIDVIYFDDTDLSYAAEDRTIRHLEALIPNPPVPLEIRNQARVHLWFGAKFSFEVAPLGCAAESLTRYASRTHAVAVRLEPGDTLHIEAPFGLDDLFAFRVTPNLAGKSRQAHIEKGKRARKVWPEVTVIDWP